MEDYPQEARVYVGLGSNLGDRAGNLLLAVRGMLNAGLGVARLSSIYETEPVGVDEEQPAYLNMVAELSGAALPQPEQLLARLLRVEYALGRRRKTPRAARTIDLDLLLYGDARRATEFLTLPHPRLQQRRFVLKPLTELAPACRHPLLQQTFAELLAASTDDAAVRLWKPGLKKG
jgi:2-amino-4-hydroxy-6-hydroxymethyldihydropteridine diphosphokinase